MGAGLNNRRDLMLRLVCGTLLLVAVTRRVQGRRMPWEWRHGDVWGRGGTPSLAVVVHARRHLQTSAQYCVASASADAGKLQDALNWACGPQGSSGGGVDCSAIQETGSCYSPNTLQNHASYAFDYYYVQQNGAANSCDFGGLATTTSTNPSSGSCVYPSLSSGVSSSTPTSSNFSSSPVNSTFGSPISSSPTSAAVGPRLSWFEVRWSAVIGALLAACLQL